MRHPRDAVKHRRDPAHGRRARPTGKARRVRRSRVELVGDVGVEGRARATRYHASESTSLSVLRSRRLHERAARRLAGNPALREVARDRLEKLRQVNPHGRVYHDRWQALLDGPLTRLLRAMTEASEQSDAMRQESPLTGLVTAEERRRVFESIRAA